MPPLKERIDDLLTILEMLGADTLGTTINRQSFSSLAMQTLREHHWPGNEMELRSVLGALAGRSSGELIQPEELQPLLRSEIQFSRGPGTRNERDRIVDALWRHGFNRTRSAEALGMSRKTLYNKITKFGLSG